MQMLDIHLLKIAYFVSGLKLDHLFLIDSAVIWWYKKALALKSLLRIWGCAKVGALNATNPLSQKNKTFLRLFSTRGSTDSASEMNVLSCTFPSPNIPIGDRGGDNRLELLPHGISLTISIAVPSFLADKGRGAVLQSRVETDYNGDCLVMTIGAVLYRREGYPVRQKCPLAGLHCVCMVTRDLPEFL
jgi:hypothetical protein